jgi:hypothetical protein
MITRATLSTWGLQLIRALSFVWVLPLLLLYLSPAQLSVWYLMFTLTRLAQLLDCGGYPVFSRLIAYRLGDHRVSMGDGAGNVWSRIPLVVYRRALVRVFGVASLLVASMLVLAGIPSTAALAAADGVGVDAWWCLAATAAGILFMMQGLRSIAILTGCNRIVELRLAESSWGLVQIALVTVSLMWGRSLVAAVLSVQFTAVGQAVTVMLMSRRIVEPSSSAADTEAFPWSAARTQLWRSMVGQVSVTGTLHLVGALLPQFATPALTASYLLTTRVIGMIVEIAQAPFYTLLPVLARLHAVGRGDELRQRSMGAMRQTAWLLVVGFMALVLMGAPALQWMGSRTPLLGIWLLVGLCTANLMERFTSLHIQNYTVSGDVLWHTINGVGGGLLLAGLLLWSPWLGLGAVPLAMVTSQALWGMRFAATRSYRFMQTSGWAFERRTWLPAAAVWTAFVAIAWGVSASAV